MLFKSLIFSKLSLKSSNSSINKNNCLSFDETFNTIVSTNSTSQVFTRPHYVGY